MSRSAIYTVNNTSTTVSPGSAIPLGDTVRRFGCNVNKNGNTIALTGKGYYLITAIATVSAATVGDVGVEMLENAEAVVGASGASSISAEGETATIPITAIVRNVCDCPSANILFNLTTTEATVLNFAVSIVKL